MNLSRYNFNSKYTLDISCILEYPYIVTSGDKELTIGDKIRILRSILKISQRELARRLGVKSSYISKLESNYIQNPSLKTLKRLAEVFNMSVDEFLKWEPGYKGETTLKESVRESASEYIAVKKVPLLNRVPAGYPTIPGEDYIEEYLPVPDTVKDPQAFALRISGDSMAPRIKEGDIVIVSPNAYITSGDIVVARINNNEVTVKKLKIQDDKVVLIPLNPNYEPLYFEKDKLEIIGKVVLIVSKP